MSAVKRGKTWCIKFRPFGEQIQLALKDCQSKSQAERIEDVILESLRRKDYCNLTGAAREALIKLFVNQSWEVPPELRPPKVEAPPKEFTFWDAVELYVKDPRFRQLSDTKRYEAKLEHLVKFFGKSRPVKEIWVSDLKQFRTHRASEEVKNATINRDMAALSAIFGVLIEHQILEANPCRPVKRLSEKDSEREVYISFEDFIRIVDATPERYHDFWWVLYLTDLRRNEAFELRWKQIDLRSRIILFHRVETKEAGFKRVPIHRDLMPVFERIGKVRTLGSDSLWQWGYHAPSDP